MFDISTKIVNFVENEKTFYMAIKIGDKVRFLNATGGGVVNKIISKELIEVTDQDGFDIPVLTRECVVIESGGKTDTSQKSQENKQEKNVKPEEILPVEEEYVPQEETPEGENLNVWIAFLPVDIKVLSITSYECFLINDSNYYLGYNIANGNGTRFMSRSTGFIQPNTKVFIEEIKKEQLNDLELLNIQLLAFKRDKAYSQKPSYDVQLKINPVKFYKLHSFSENDFFDEKAILFEIVKNNLPADKIAVMIPENLSEIMMQKESKSPAKVIKKEALPEVLEVDLHINQLLDNLNGLTNADMLKYQLDKFNQTLQENAKRKGQKIVFIHGKGDGVLRNEMLKQLKSKYPTYYSQDASFREYGFGATMVTIR
jgi:dsDNA-specific endonuclease/ATPase MutS2